MNHVFNRLANDAWIDVPEGQGYLGKIFSKEKFAELIVLECAKAAYKYTDDSKNYEHYDDIGWDCLPGDLQSHIKEHFGVKK